MSKHTLFVCKSCHRSSEEPAADQPCDGKLLLHTLNVLSVQKFTPQELEIKPVGCLWACERGCVAALANSEKRTYLFVDLPPGEECVSALLEVTRMYINHPKGAFIWDKLPQQMKPAMFACIPPSLSFSAEDDSEEEL